MGSRTNRKSNPAKVRSSTGKKHVCVQQAAKKRHQKWSKDRSERALDVLNHAAGLLYNALENPSPLPSTIPQTDSVVSLAECMQGLGR